MAWRGQKRRTLGRVGLDIGSHTVKAIEVVEHGAELVVRSAGSVRIARARLGYPGMDAPSVVQALKSLWSSAQFEAQEVVVAAPPDYAHVKWLHLETSDDSELSDVARSAGVRGAPFPASDAIVDYRVLSTRTTSSRSVHFVMLAAVSSSSVDNLLDITGRAGLTTRVVDIEAVAALRSFDPATRAGSCLWDGQPRAHCVIGARGTTITVARACSLEFVRTVPVGGNDFTQCIADAAGVDWESAEKMKLNPDTMVTEDGTLVISHQNTVLKVGCQGLLGRLAREIRRSLRFYTGQFAEGSYLGMIGATTLSGGGSLLKGLDLGLSLNGIEVKSVVNPFAGFSVEAGGSGIRGIGDRGPAYSIAMGLAIADFWERMPVMAQSAPVLTGALPA